MKKTLALFAVLIMAVSSASAGMLIFEGNGDRGELPYPAGGGKAVIDVYAEGIMGVAGIQTSFNFLHLPENQESNALFQIAIDEGNLKYKDFDYQMIDLGPSIPSGVFPICSASRDTVGFMLLSDTIDFPQKTLLYSARYDYADGTEGGYVIANNPDFTVISDDSANAIFYTAVSGNLTITVPEPAGAILLGCGLACLLVWRLLMKMKNR